MLSIKSIALPRTRKLTIIAQDPGVRDVAGRILLTQIEIPAEELAPGPRGYRVHVVDYDTSTGTLYQPQAFEPLSDGCYLDPYAAYIETDDKDTDELLAEPGFHAQNVYAIVMRTLARFEFALGRRINWGFNGHQIYVAPHAFADANAFYSERDQALAFGYFCVPGADEKESSDEEYQPIIFTCLSHDVVAHETTHALLDGLRERYTAPSSPEQAGFHEGFSDAVALLSVFSLKDVVRFLLLKPVVRQSVGREIAENHLPVEFLSEESLKNTALFGLADQMGQELSGIRGSALRRSASLPPFASQKSIDDFKSREFQEPHRCGERLVAAMMNAFLKVWLSRLDKYMKGRSEVDVSLVVEAGAEAAEHLLTMAIRALDYMPPTDIRFHDYLSALLTADRETVPDDSRYGYREILRESFAAYGINPAPKTGENGFWNTVDGNFSYDRTHFESLLRDPNEIFRFIWDNRHELRLETEQDYFGKAYMRVQSVRPCLRIGPDGFIVRETIAEYVQMTTLRADEFPPLGINILSDLPDEIEITLYGGGTLIFDEYGRLKYHIANSIFSRTYQPERIRYLWRSGYFRNPAFTENIFSRMHLDRVLSRQIDETEGF